MSRPEPVLIGQAVSALVALAFAVATHHLTEGVVTAACMALVAFLVRQRVTPLSDPQLPAPEVDPAP